MNLAWNKFKFNYMDRPLTHIYSTMGNLVTKVFNAIETGEHSRCDMHGGSFDLWHYLIVFI